MARPKIGLVEMNYNEDNVRRSRSKVLTNASDATLVIYISKAEGISYPSISSSGFSSTDFHCIVIITPNTDIAIKVFVIALKSSAGDKTSNEVVGLTSLSI